MRVRTTEIPAGKYAGKYREGMNVSCAGKTTSGPYRMKHVVCGACKERYRAHKRTCPNCGGPDDE